MERNSTRRSAGLLLATLLGSSALAQWQSLSGGVNHLVHSFLVDEENDELIVAGSFIQTNNDSTQLRGLGQWNGTAWSTLAGGSGDTINGSMNAVWSLAKHHDTLFIAHGNNLWHYDQAMGGAAYLTDSTWHACGSPTNNFFVFEENDRLFGGGADTLQGSYMPGVVEWVGGEWTTPPGSPFVTGADVYGSAYWHGQYYFGGVFLVEGSRKIVAYDGVDQWTGLGGGVGGVHINTIEGYGDSLYVGGFFTPGPDVQSKHIQIWDGAEWKPFFSEVVMLGQVWDLVVHENSLYMACAYRFSDDVVQYGLLRFDGQNLCAIGGPFDTGGSTRRLAFHNGGLYGTVPSTFSELPEEFIGRLELTGLVPDRCVTVATGTTESDLATTFNLAPNPTRDKLMVQWEQNSDGVVELLDGSGRLLRTMRVQNRAQVALDIHELAAGLYMVRVMSGSENMTGRFVKE